MKKKFLKLASVLMVITMVFTMAFSSFTVSAADGDTSEVGEKIVTFLEKAMYNVSQKIIDVVVGGITKIIPNPGWGAENEYVSENFMEGMTEFLDEPAEGAKWNLGYASDSLLTGNELDNKHFVAGGIVVSPKYATEIIDDSRVRTIAINDGSGRGTAVFVVIDAYGLANNDVREIRSRVEAFALRNDIVSVNVSVLHQHSVIDTFGMNGDILKAVFLNPFASFLNNTFDSVDIKLSNGKNDAYMENLFTVTAKSIRTACKNMTEGKLYYSEIDVSEYVYDKRLPYALNTDMERLRFVPDDGSKETWLATSVIHCVGNGVQGTEVFADFPYYMEEVINAQADANFMLMLGAEMSTSQEKDSKVIPELSEATSRIEEVQIYGRALGRRLMSIDNNTEKEVAPLLNVKHKEVSFKAENQIILLAAKAGLFENEIVITENGEHRVVSEIGYVEFGTDLAAVLVPGELEAAIAYGGALDKTASWSGEDWNYASLQETVGNDRHLLVFGLTNDQLGYIVPDNDFMPMLVPESKSVEFVSLGDETGSHLVEEFESLIESVK